MELDEGGRVGEHHLIGRVISSLPSEVKERKELSDLSASLRATGNPIPIFVSLSKLCFQLLRRVYEAVERKPPSDNLNECIEDARKAGILPSEIATSLHFIRVWSNMVGHAAERVRLKAYDAWTALGVYLRVLEWFYCEFERGPRLSDLRFAKQKDVFVPEVFERQLSSPIREGTRDIPKIVEKAYPSVVQIETNRGTGSGFLADSSGLVVTNYHVMRGATEIFVKFQEGIKVKAEGIHAQDAERDFAILKIGMPPGLSLKPLRMGDSAQVKLGEEIVVLGNPLGFEKTITTGVVSAIHPEEERIQISAPIYEGSSGGPVLNLEGEVIGISVSGIQTERGYTNINFMVPINCIKEALIPREVRWEFLKKWAAHEAPITALAFSPDGLTLFSADSKGLLKRWNLLDFSLAESMKGFSRIVGIAFFSKEKWEIWESGKVIKLRGMKKEEEVALGRGVRCAHMDRRSGMVAVGCEEGEASLLIPGPGGHEVRPLPLKDRSPVRDIQLIRQAIYTLVVQESGVMTIFNNTLSPYPGVVREFQWFGEVRIQAARFDPSGNVLAIGESHGGVHWCVLTDVEKGKVMPTQLLRGQSLIIGDPITKLAFSPSGAYLAVGTKGGNILLWKQERA